MPIKGEPLSEEMRRVFYGRTAPSTYKLHATEKVKIRQRLKAFEKIKQPEELQRRETYRLRAAREGRVMPLGRDVGGARRGLIPGLPPGPMNIFAGMGLAGLGAKIAAPGAAKGLFYVARRGAFYKLAQALGGAMASTRQPAQPIETPHSRVEYIKEAARKVVGKVPRDIPQGAMRTSPRRESIAEEVKRMRGRVR